MGSVVLAHEALDKDLGFENEGNWVAHCGFCGYGEFLVFWVGVVGKNLFGVGVFCLKPLRVDHFYK